MINCMIGNFINSGVLIKADYFVGNTKAIISVGFRVGKNIDYPVTLYKEDIRVLSSPTNRVLGIFVKHISQTKYTECTYLSKKHDIEKIANLKLINGLVKL